MKKYIRSSNHNSDDVEFFDLPRAYCQRVKQYILNKNPELVIYKYETDDEFLDSLDGLTAIFNTKEDLIDYVQEIISMTSDKYEKGRFEAVLNALLPEVAYSAPEQNYTYVICTGSPEGRELCPPRNTQLPSSAIAFWFTMEESYPYCACICAKDNISAKGLLEWVINNEDMFRSYYKSHRIPYKLEYLIDYCKRHVNDDKFIQWSGDQVEPFSLG